jgi:polyribonucleotide nucleotidyltransferase
LSTGEIETKPVAGVDGIGLVFEGDTYATLSSIGI